MFRPNYKLYLVTYAFLLGTKQQAALACHKFMVKRLYHNRHMQCTQFLHCVQ